MKTLMMTLAIAAMAFPFAACESKTIVEDRGADRDHATVREDTTVRERDSDGGTTYEREREHTRD